MVLVVNQARDWLPFAYGLSLIGLYLLPYVTECKAEGNRSPVHDTEATSSAVWTRNLRSRDWLLASVSSINMAVYTSTQPRLNRDLYITLDRTTFVFIMCLFLIKGIDRISIILNILFFLIYTIIVNTYTHGQAFVHTIIYINTKTGCNLFVFSYLCISGKYMCTYSV